MMAGMTACSMIVYDYYDIIIVVGMFAIGMMVKTLLPAIVIDTAGMTPEDAGGLIAITMLGLELWAVLCIGFLIMGAVPRRLRIAILTLYDTVRFSVWPQGKQLGRRVLSTMIHNTLRLRERLRLELMLGLGLGSRQQLKQLVRRETLTTRTFVATIVTLYAISFVTMICTWVVSLWIRRRIISTMMHNTLRLRERLRVEIVLTLGLGSRQQLKRLVRRETLTTRTFVATIVTLYAISFVTMICTWVRKICLPAIAIVTAGMMWCEGYDTILIGCILGFLYDIYTMVDQPYPYPDEIVVVAAGMWYGAYFMMTATTMIRTVVMPTILPVIMPLGMCLGFLRAAMVAMTMYKMVVQPTIRFFIDMMLRSVSTVRHSRDGVRKRLRIAWTNACFNFEWRQLKNLGRRVILTIEIAILLVTRHLWERCCVEWLQLKHRGRRVLSTMMTALRRLRIAWTRACVCVWQQLQHLARRVLSMMMTALRRLRIAWTRACVCAWQQLQHLARRVLSMMITTLGRLRIALTSACCCIWQQRRVIGCQPIVLTSVAGVVAMVYVVVVVATELMTTMTAMIALVLHRAISTMMTCVAMIVPLFAIFCVIIIILCKGVQAYMLWVRRPGQQEEFRPEAQERDRFQKTADAAAATAPNVPAAKAAPLSDLQERRIREVVRILRNRDNGPFRVLEIDAGTSASRIRKQWIQKSRLVHPDKHEGLDACRQATDATQILNGAHDKVK